MHSVQQMNVEFLMHGNSTVLANLLLFCFCCWQFTGTKHRWRWRRQSEAEYILTHSHVILRLFGLVTLNTHTHTTHTGREREREREWVSERERERERRVHQVPTQFNSRAKSHSASGPSSLAFSGSSHMVTFLSHPKQSKKMGLKKKKMRLIYELIAWGLLRASGPRGAEHCRQGNQMRWSRSIFLNHI